MRPTLILSLIVTVLSGCMLGPDYRRPALVIGAIESSAAAKSFHRRNPSSGEYHFAGIRRRTAISSSEIARLNLPRALLIAATSAS